MLAFFRLVLYSLEIFVLSLKSYTSKIYQLRRLDGTERTKRKDIFFMTLALVLRSGIHFISNSFGVVGSHSIRLGWAGYTFHLSECHGISRLSMVSVWLVVINVK